MLIVVVLMCVIFVLLLASFPIAIMCYCYKDRKMKRTFDLQQSRGREDNIQTERTYEIVPNGDRRTTGEASEVTYTTEGGDVAISQPTAMETQPVYDTVNTLPNSEQQKSRRESACNDPHRVYHILTNEKRTQNNSKTEDSVAVTDSAELSSVNDVVAKKDLSSPDTLYSALDHAKPKGRGRQKTGKQEIEMEDYNTLQHAKNSRLVHSVSDSQVLLMHVPPTVVYETIDKPESRKAAVPPGQPLYSPLGAPKYSLVNKKSKSTSAVEGLRNKAAGNTETLNKNTAEALNTSTVGGQIGKGNSDAVCSTLPGERRASHGKYGRTSESQAERNTESKQSSVSVVTRSTKKLPNYDVITKQDLSSLDGNAKGAIYSALDHTKPRSRKTSRESNDTYNSLEHAKNPRLAHSVSDSRVIHKQVAPTVVYETIDKPREAKDMALPGQPVYSTLGTPKYSLVNKKSKSTSAVEGLRKQAGTVFDNSSATGNSTAGMEKVGQNSPSTKESMGGTLDPLLKEVQHKGKPSWEIRSPPQPPDRPPKSTVS